MFHASSADWWALGIRKSGKGHSIGKQITKCRVQATVSRSTVTFSLGPGGGVGRQTVGPPVREGAVAAAVVRRLPLPPRRLPRPSPTTEANAAGDCCTDVFWQYYRIDAIFGHKL